LLLGRIRAARALGEADIASEQMTRLREIWASADPALMEQANKAGEDAP
jgi:hypothetical protein